MSEATCLTAAIAILQAIAVFGNVTIEKIYLDNETEPLVSPLASDAGQLHVNASGWAMMPPAMPDPIPLTSDASTVTLSPALLRNRRGAEIDLLAPLAISELHANDTRDRIQESSAEALRHNIRPARHVLLPPKAALDIQENNLTEPAEPQTTSQPRKTMLMRPQLEPKLHILDESFSSRTEVTESDRVRSLRQRRIHRRQLERDSAGGEHNRNHEMTSTNEIPRPTERPKPKRKQRQANDDTGAEEHERSNEESIPTENYVLPRHPHPVRSSGSWSSERWERSVSEAPTADPENPPEPEMQPEVESSARERTHTKDLVHESPDVKDDENKACRGRLLC